jgi:hypothetical protein
VAQPWPWTHPAYRPRDLPIVRGTSVLVNLKKYYFDLEFFLEVRILTNVRSFEHDSFSISSVLVYGHAIKAIVHEKVSPDIL